MARTVRVETRNLNRLLLLEELIPLLPQFHMTMGGYERLTQRISTPTVASVVVTRRKITGQPLFEDIAQPGEIWWRTEVPLTVQEGNDLDAVLSAHDETGVSEEQARENQDSDDIGRLITALQDWNSLSAGQKDTATRRILRLLLRRYAQQV